MSSNICTYEDQDGEMVTIDIGNCQDFADSLTSQMEAYHNQIEKGDFYTVACCVIEHIVAQFRDSGMDDDHLLEYMLYFVKNGECH